MPLASRPKGLRQSRPPVRVADSAANTCWVSGSKARLVAQPDAKLRAGEGATLRWTCCATVGAWVELRSDDLDHADWAAVRPTKQPAQPELGRCNVDVEACRTTHTEQQHEAGQPHLRARACAWGTDETVSFLHSTARHGRPGCCRVWVQPPLFISPSVPPHVSL